MTPWTSTRNLHWGAGLRHGVIGVVAGIAMGFAGCQSTPKPSPGTAQAPRRIDPGATVESAPSKGPRAASVTYAEVASAYNTRIRRLECVTANAEIHVESRDNEGKAVENNAEGFLLLVRPRKVSLRIDKVSQTYFVLGSDSSRYWWLDLSGEKRLGLVGLHRLASPQSAAAFGVPVYPLDLLEMLGVMPLPEDESSLNLVVPTLRKDGRLEIVLPGRGREWGSKRYVLDRVTFLPVKIELLDAKGGIAASGELSRWVDVTVEGEALSGAAMPSNLDVDLPGMPAKVMMRLNDVKNPGVDKIKSANFDLERLKGIYRVDEFYALDEAPKPGTAQSPTRSSDEPRGGSNIERGGDR